jgi:hypothetical protein
MSSRAASHLKGKEKPGQNIGRALRLENARVASKARLGLSQHAVEHGEDDLLLGFARCWQRVIAESKATIVGARAYCRSSYRDANRLAPPKSARSIHNKLSRRRIPQARARPSRRARSSSRTSSTSRPRAAHTFSGISATLNRSLVPIFHPLQRGPV